MSAAPHTALAIALAIAAAACGGSAPPTRYYQLAAPEAISSAAAPSGIAIAVEPLAADGAYDDERIVYRLDPVRLDYYDYHRWSTSPGAMIGHYVQAALARTGAFADVSREVTASTAVTVSGHVTALEEIDVDRSRWVGHIALELTVADAKTGQIVWSHAYDEREPEPTQSPEGLAHAIGVALSRIVDAAAPQIADIASRQAAARGIAPAPPAVSSAK